MSHFRKLISYILEEFFGNDTGPGVNGQFHLADLLVDFLHEVDNKVHQLVFVHLLRVEVGNQEANIISLYRCETTNRQMDWSSPLTQDVTLSQ